MSMCIWAVAFCYPFFFSQHFKNILNYFVGSSEEWVQILYWWSDEIKIKIYTI